MKESITCYVCDEPIITNSQCIEGYWLHNNCIMRLVKDFKPVRCCICGNVIKHSWCENNPRPYKDSGVCCNKCNEEYVIPERIRKYINYNK